MGQCSGVSPGRRARYGPVMIVVTWPFVVTVVVSRSVNPFEPCEPQARPAPRPDAKRSAASVSRIASQLGLRLITL